MKLATYDVNGVNGRLPRLLEWLEETSPDVVCLQEIKTSDEKCPARVLERAGYGALWHGQRSHHGVAVLARGEQPASSSPPFICRTATRSPDRSSTTSSPGSSA